MRIRPLLIVVAATIVIGSGVAIGQGDNAIREARVRQAEKTALPTWDTETEAASHCGAEHVVRVVRPGLTPKFGCAIPL